MQMKALRSANFAKLSSSNSTRDAYWVRSISAGTPAGYCLSQMRSMLIPLWFVSPFAGAASFRAVLVLGSIEQAAARWQAPAPGGRMADREGAGLAGRRKQLSYGVRPRAWPRWPWARV